MLDCGAWDANCNGKFEEDEDEDEDDDDDDEKDDSSAVDGAFLRRRLAAAGASASASVFDSVAPDSATPKSDCGGEAVSAPAPRFISVIENSAQRC